MTFQEKRKLFEKAFAGKDTEGKRLGIYARKSENSDRPMTFTIKGVLGEIEGMLPLSRLELEEIMGPEGVTNFASYYRAEDLRGYRSPADNH